MENSFYSSSPGKGYPSEVDSLHSAGNSSNIKDFQIRGLDIRGSTVRDQKILPCADITAQISF